MANIKFTDLPSTSAANVADIICAVQGGANVQLTQAQVLDLFRDNIVLNFAGDPNGNVAGEIYELLIDTVNFNFYICTTSGVAGVAVWTLIAVDLTGMTDGQLLIGDTGSFPKKSTLTGGTGISIVNGAGSITISSTGAFFPATEVTGTSQVMAGNNSYVANNAALVSLQLPATSNLGDTMQIVGKGAGGWQVTQLAGQQIHIGSNSSSVGVGGSVASSNQFDSVILYCSTANLTWSSLAGPQGTLTVT